ncbi:CotY/CotZ family spore coat protein [Halobacillus mangrovi]|nr:CotY/CotZ family spore coat protein [Halobacillus mangrovi]
MKKNCYDGYYDESNDLVESLESSDCSPNHAQNHAQNHAPRPIPSGSNSNGNDLLNCVCSVLADIQERQDNANTPSNGCVNDFCSMVNNNPDTIPVVLTTKENTALFGFINLEDNDCEITVYFRVNNVNEDTGCVQLELLLPNEGRQIAPGNQCCVRLNQICGAGPALTLERTGQCIVVDCDCLCTIQCLDPNVVMNGNGNGGSATARRRRAATETE